MGLTASETPRRNSLGKLRRCGLAAVAAVLMSNVSAPHAQAYAYTGCRWASATIPYDNQTSGANATAFNNAASQWTTKTDVNMPSRPGGTTNLFFIVNNNGANGEVGFASWDCASSGTFSATASLNAYYTNSMSATDRQKVATHEVGHTIGLEHSGTRAAIMYRPALQATTNVPGPDDISGINARY